MKRTENKNITITDARTRLTDFGARLSNRRLLYAALIIVSILCGLMLTRLPVLKQFVMIAAIPAILMVIFILKDPINGVFLFFLYDYLRPSDFIPALRPLRLSLVIELLTLISWLLYLKQTKIGLKWNKLHYYYFGFLIVIAITIPLAYNNHVAYNMFQAMAVNFIIYLIATNRIDSIGRLNKLIWMLLLIFAYFALKGIYNYAVLRHVVGSERTSGAVGGSFISDENDFALALNFMIPFAFFYFLEIYKGIKKYFVLGILILLVLGVIASNSRGGWIGLMVALLLGILWSKRKVLGMVIACFLAVAIVLFAPSNYWGEVESISQVHEGTAQARIYYWKAGVKMFLSHPLFGVGAGNGPIRMPEYVTGFRNTNTQWGRTFHGTFPQVMAELGGAGLLIYLAMILYSISRMRKVLKIRLEQDGKIAKTIAKAIIVSIIAYIVTAIFLSTAYYPELWTLYVLTAILLFTIKPKADPDLTLNTEVEGPFVNDALRL